MRVNRILWDRIIKAGRSGNTAEVARLNRYRKKLSDAYGRYARNIKGSQQYARDRKPARGDSQSAMVASLFAENRGYSRNQYMGLNNG